MGQVLHGSATTTHAVRAAIQRSQASVAELAERYSLNEKTVRKWRRRSTVEDARMGPKAIRSSVLGPEEEAMWRLSGILCGGRFHSVDPEALAEGDGELRPGLDPFLGRPFPVCGSPVENEV